jgi:hypothetical protein
VSSDQIKREVASLSREDQDKLIAYAIQLRYASDIDYRHEVTERLNDETKAIGSHPKNLSADWTINPNAPLSGLHKPRGSLLTAPRSGPQRRAVMDFIASLSSNPFLRGDFRKLTKSAEKSL